jgi:hypothetical protein
MSHSHEYISPDDIPRLLANLLEGILKFSEFIADQNPDEYHTRILLMLETIKESLETNNLPLPRSDMIEFEARLIEFLITWNPKIETQCRKFYKIYEQIYNLNDKLFLNPDDNPLSLIIKNLDRYYHGSKVSEKIIQHYDYKSITEIDFYSYFFAIIVTAEAMEYYYYTTFKNYLKSYNIQDVDAEEIFSLNEKWRDKNGVYISEIRAMRNAIAHYNFVTKYDEKNINSSITFFVYPEKQAESRTYSSNEIVDFLGEYRYLLQTFENILFVMYIFKTIQSYFSIDSKSDL